MNSSPKATCKPWNKVKIIGKKIPLRPKDIWSIRVRLQMQPHAKELALFNLGFDSKLRGYDLVSLGVRDVCHGSQVAHRAIVMQRKTHCPVQFEITSTTRESLESGMKEAGLGQEDYLFPSRIHESLTSALDNTQGSCIIGWRSLVSAPPLTERTRCAAATPP